MHRSAPKNRLNASSSATKIALFLVGILSGGVAARTAVPVAAGVLSSAIPRFWASIQSWLAPPYLFFAVHVIIFVIWRLSETKQSSGSHWAAPAAEEKTPEAANTAKTKSFGSYHAEPLVRKPSPEFWQGIHQTPEPVAFSEPAAFSETEPGESPQSDTSCVTRESVETPGSPASSGFEMKKSVEPALETSVVTLANDEAATAAKAMAAEEEDEGDEEENASLEATWKAIMEKSSRPAAPPLPEATGGRSPRPPAVNRGGEPPRTIHEDLNQKFDDFIKKHHKQMRLQRHESDQRRAETEMVNRSPN